MSRGPDPEAGAGIERELRAWIAEYAHQGPDGQPSDDRFERLALAIYGYQLEHNPAYRRFAERRGASAAPSTWLDIPALPAPAMKEAAFATFDPQEAAVVFRTSGTTTGRPGRHYVKETGLYEAALSAHFRHFVLPDLPRGERILTLRLFPDLPDSSLSHMLRTVADRFGVDGGVYLAGSGGLDGQGLAGALRRAEREGRPILILGAVLGLLAACESLAEARLRFRLPAGSRIMETGGFKGRRRQVSTEELHATYLQRLGVTESMVVNEYGMTELASQFYDSALRAAVAGEGWREHEPGRLVPPPWVRVRAVDPGTLRPLPPGRRGLLQVCDLANLHTVPFLLLEDVGRVDERGRLTLEGRAEGAEARGCSLTAEDLTAWRGPGSVASGPSAAGGGMGA